MLRYMFKAKLIDDEVYYSLKNKIFVLGLIPSFFIGILANFFQLPLWLTIIALVAYLMILYFIYKKQTEMNYLLGNKLLEVNEKEIIIKNKKGERIKIIGITQANKITLNADMGIPQEGTKDFIGELKGETKRNYLIFSTASGEHQFNFEVESYYMLKQLDKLINYWRGTGIEIIKKEE